MFSSSEFLDLGSRKAVDIALLRLTKAGTIRRLTRGLYYFPKTSPLLGELHPTVEAVAKAIEARDHEPSFKAVEVGGCPRNWNRMGKQQNVSICLY